MNIGEWTGDYGEAEVISPVFFMGSTGLEQQRETDWRSSRSRRSSRRFCTKRTGKSFFNSNLCKEFHKDHACRRHRTVTV